MLNVFSKLKMFLIGQEIIESERRRAIRIPCRMKAGVVGVGAPVQVLNISVLGVRIESMTRLNKGSEVILEGREYMGRPLTAKVIWSQGRGKQWISGLCFTGSNEEKAASWVRTALDKMGVSQNKVREKRTHVRVPASGITYLANRAGDRLCEGTLVNIGLGGALFSSEVRVEPGTGVSLQSDTVGRPKLDEAGVIRSCRKDVRNQCYLVGIQFTDTGSPPVRKFLKQINR